MKLDPAIRDQVLATVPSLRAFAISLSGNVDRADDLVQEALLRALAHIDSFEPGTNMSAWLFTILAQSVPLGISQAPARSRRCRRPFAESLTTLTNRPSSSRNSVRRCKTSLGTTRVPYPGRRLGILLRGRSGHLRLRGRHDQEPRQPRTHPACQTCLQSTTPMISGRTARPEPYWPAAAAAKPTANLVTSFGG